METFNKVEITSDRNLVLQFFEATMNLAPIGVFIYSLNPQI